MTQSPTIGSPPARPSGGSVDPSADGRRLDETGAEPRFDGVMRDLRPRRAKTSSPAASNVDAATPPSPDPLKVAPSRAGDSTIDPSSVMSEVKGGGAPETPRPEPARRPLADPHVLSSALSRPMDRPRWVAGLHSEPANRPSAPAGSEGQSSLCEVHLTQNLTRMLAEGTHSAVIRLTPEHLGEVEIRLTLSQNDLSVEFGAASAGTRAALEQAMPKLGEQLSQTGLTLVSAQVVGQLAKDGWVTMSRPLMVVERPSKPTEAPPVESRTPGKGAKRRLVDLYA